MSEWLGLCFTKSIVKRACISALVVGTVLILINHGDAILRGDMDTLRLIRIVLTVVVPYLVSTVSSVSTTMSIKKESQSK
jgi:hypothetical protein